MNSSTCLFRGRLLWSSACLLLSVSIALGDVLITEFMASNRTTLTALDGTTPDWIEIYNSDDASVSLHGLSLTTDPMHVETWPIPARTLGPRESVIVYASGEDGRVASDELHTDFKLSKSAGYLALLRESDDAVLSEYEYPEQFEDVSYGLAQGGETETVTFLSEGAPVRWRVPSAEIPGWQNVAFNDAAWSLGTTGIGYETGSGYESLIGPGADVESAMVGENTSVYARIPFRVNSKEGLIGLTLRMKYDDGFVAYLNGERVASALAPPALPWNASAVDEHLDALALSFEDFNLNGQFDQLRVGDNVLAIHGLNRGVSSSDLLFMPVLQGIRQGEAELGVVDFFTMATPGEPNVSAQGLPSGLVAFSIPGRGFSGTLSLSLSSESPGATIRYTLDGSVPSLSSTRFSGSPITIGASTLVRARAFETGRAPGPVIDAAYLHLASNVRGMSSNLPIVVLDQLGGGPLGGNGKAFTFWAIFEPGEDGGRTQLLGDYAMGTRAGYQVRGSSSSGFAKQSWTIEAWDEANANKNVSPLGMPEESDWILSGRYTFDRALMRNPLIYALSNQLGRYAVRTRFVEVYLNTNGGDLQSSDYHGVYTLMEKISRDADRVDVERLPEGVTTEPGVAGGYVLKIDRADPGDNGFVAAGQDIRYVYPKEENVTVAQSSYIQGYINAFGDALNGPDFADPLLGYERYIDVDAFIDHHLLNVLTLNADALRLSTYMFKPRDGKLQMGPIWDFDRSMGSTDGRDENPLSWVGGTNYFTYPWWNRLFADENFWQRYIDRYFELREGAFATATIHGLIDEFAGQLSEAQVRNFQRWTAVPPRFGGYQGEVNHLKDWLQDRVEWMDGQFLAVPKSSVRSGEIAAGTGIVLTASGLTGGREIRYTLDGSDPRPRVIPAVFESEVLLDEGAVARVLVPSASIGTAWRESSTFNDSAWILGRNGVGYDDNSNYDPYIETNLEGANLMKGVNTSAYVRMNFDVTADQLARFNVLSLQMRFDDGFVAYLNGSKIAEVNAPGVPDWNAGATGTNDDAAAIRYEQFDLRQAVASLRLGRNLLAIHGLNSGATSSDFLIQARLLGGEMEEGNGGEVVASTYTGTITLTKSAVLVARVFDPNGGNSTNSGRVPVGTGWSAPLTMRYLVGEEAASASNLAVTELMVDPRGFGDGRLPDEAFEYVELMNIGDKPVDLTGVRLDGGLTFGFPARSVEPGERVLVASNVVALTESYGAVVGEQILGAYSGQLGNGGDAFRVVASDGTVIRSVVYDNGEGWPGGANRALLVSDPLGGVDVDEPMDWQTSSAILGTPGAAERGVIMPVRIQEVLSNSEPPAVDAIELVNVSADLVNLSGWRLTDDLDSPGAFVIPEGTLLEAGGTVVFAQDQWGSFALSSSGETVFLMSADDQGRMDGGLDVFAFGASPIGVTYGRLVNSIDEVYVALLETASLGSANDSVRVGPLVITEIMADPAPDGVEFIEIANTGASAVDLAGVRVNGAGFAFEGGVLAAGELMILAGNEPDLFRQQYAVPSRVVIVGPFPARLDNAGETVSLLVPDTVEPQLAVPADQVRYQTVAPWPMVAGNGASLERVELDAFGSEPLVWRASSQAGGSPGRHPGLGGVVPPDPEVTGDAWKQMYFSAAELVDAAISGDLADADGDGFANMLEYVLGASPIDDDDVPMLEIDRLSEGIRVRFQALVGRRFHRVTLESSEDLLAWDEVTEPSGEAVSLPENPDVEVITYAWRETWPDGPVHLRLRVERILP